MQRRGSISGSVRRILLAQFNHEGTGVPSIFSISLLFADFLHFPPPPPPFFLLLFFQLFWIRRRNIRFCFFFSFLLPARCIDAIIRKDFGLSIMIHRGNIYDGQGVCNRAIIMVLMLEFIVGFHGEYFAAFSV